LKSLTRTQKKYIMIADAGFMQIAMLYTHVSDKKGSRIQSPLDRIKITKNTKGEKKDDKK
jgi:hypothetical protein